MNSSDKNGCTVKMTSTSHLAQRVIHYALVSDSNIVQDTLVTSMSIVTYLARSMIVVRTDYNHTASMSH